VTLRAIDTLKRADIVAAEDTRNTRGLLTHLGISAKLVALHEHNERRGAQQVIGWIAEGKSVALVSDAGTPAVSDPGTVLVDAVRAAGHRVIPVPGASALTAALSASGIAFDGAVFAGFLPVKGRERRERLAALAAAPWAIVLFEAPHRIAATLADLHAALGERDVVNYIAFRLKAVGGPPPPRALFTLEACTKIAVASGGIDRTVSESDSVGKALKRAEIVYARSVDQLDTEFLGNGELEIEELDQCHPAERIIEQQESRVRR